jgi:predicted transcriptional regulator
MATNICVYLPEHLAKEIDKAAAADDRSRSAYIRRTLERAVTGHDRLAALEEIAAEGLEDYAANVTRERGPNPGQVIAESSTDGHRRLEALEKIAKGAK